MISLKKCKLNNSKIQLLPLNEFFLNVLILHYFYNILNRNYYSKIKYAITTLIINIKLRSTFKRLK